MNDLSECLCKNICTAPESDVAYQLFIPKPEILDVFSIVLPLSSFFIFKFIFLYEHLKRNRSNSDNLGIDQPMDKNQLYDFSVETMKQEKEEREREEKDEETENETQMEEAM